MRSMNVLRHLSERWQPKTKGGHAIFPLSRKKDASLSLSSYLTPSMLEEELKKIDSLGVPIFIFHMKPQYLVTLTAEIEQLNYPNISLLKQGDEFTF